MTDEIKSGRDLYDVGRQHMDHGHISEAIECFRRSGATDPHYKTFELLGECLLSESRPAEAILYLSAAAGLGSRSFRAYFLLAKALSQTEHKDWAIAKLDQALQLNPEYAAARDFRNELASSV